MSDSIAIPTVEDEAAELLPCNSPYHQKSHNEDCPAWYRPAVAERLRQRDEERLKTAAMMDFQQERSAALEGALQRIADGAGNPSFIARAALAGRKADG